MVSVLENEGGVMLIENGKTHIQVRHSAGGTYQLVHVLENVRRQLEYNTALQYVHNT